MHGQTHPVRVALKDIMPACMPAIHPRAHLLTFLTSIRAVTYVFKDGFTPAKSKTGKQVFALFLRLSAHNLTHTVKPKPQTPQPPPRVEPTVVCTHAHV